MPTILNHTDVAIILPTGHEIPPNGTKAVSVDVATSVDNGPYLRLKMKTRALSFCEADDVEPPLNDWIAEASLEELHAVLSRHGIVAEDHEAADAVRSLSQA